MEQEIKSFAEFLLEYYTSDAPGSVVVPGEWYRDGVNSRNYRPAYTQMPQVVDAMFQTTDLYNYLDSLSEEEEFGQILQEKHKDPKEIIKYMKRRIHEELSPNAKDSK